MMRRAALLLWIAANSAPPSLASSPVTWEHPATAGQPAAPGVTTAGGERLEGVRMEESGALTLSLPRREVFPAGSSIAAPQILWTSHLDRDGNLYLGAGNTGEIYRLDPKGAAALYADTDEIGVRAIGSDRGGNVYAATFPRGALYRIDPEGTIEPYYDSEERYLWAMQVDSDGTVFMATGERGDIDKIVGKADGTTFFDSDEAHITTLVKHPAGYLLAGTDPGGLVYILTNEGKADVFLDTDLREISAIAVSPDGTVFAAAISEQRKKIPRDASRRGDLTIEVTPSADGGVLEESTEKQKIVIDLAELLPEGVPGAEGSAGRIYRIAPGEPPQLVWQSDGERVYAMVHSARHGLLFGTGGPGSNGHLYRLEGDGSRTMLHRFSEPQITSLVEGGDGRVYASTANPGRTYVIEEGTTASGTYASPVLDAGRLARWGAIAWDSDIPSGTRIEVATRSGNRPNPDDTWSQWSAPYPIERGSEIASPAARYLQWRAELTRLKTEDLPRLRRVKVTLLPKNQKPLLSSVRILRNGEPHTAEARDAGGKEEKQSEPVDPPQGSRWVSWRSTDPDGDDLDHSIAIRGEGETGFREIARSVRKSPYALAEGDLAEGSYRIRIEADDRSINGPEGLAVSSESDTFLVDHSPPRLEARQPSSAEPGKGRMVAEILATDALGPIGRGEYSIAGGEGEDRWTPLRCGDGICDTASELFILEIDSAHSGKKVSVRVQDASGNATTLDVPDPAFKGGN